MIREVYALKPNEYSLASFFVIGSGNAIQSLHCIICDCGENLDEDGYHLVICKHEGGLIWIRNMSVKGWSDCLREIQVHHHVGPRNRHTDNENRPDIVAFDALNGTSTELDVSMAHSWSEVDTLRRAAKESKYTADIRDTRNQAKYKKLRTLSESQLNLVP